MDERRLAELLNDAVADVPPPSFGRDDISRESARQRARRRNGIITGSALGVALLAGTTALSVALWTGQDSAGQSNAANGDAASGNENAAPYELPDRDGSADEPTQRGGLEEGSPPESRKQGRTSDGEAGPAGPGSTSSGCEQVDRELAAALAGELPSTANLSADDAVPVLVRCPPASAGAMFPVPGGTITVIVTTSGASVDDQATASARTERAAATAPDGRTVTVVSMSTSAATAPPYAGELDEWAGAVALEY